MADRQDFMLNASYGTALRCYHWPAENSRAVTVIVHGMAEHAARYGRLASALNTAGISAMSVDLRGHGQTCGCERKKGYFAAKDGWKVVLEDMRQLTLRASELYPDLPIV